MENNWFIEQPAELRAWQPKLNLIERSSPYSTDCQINANHDIDAIKIWLEQYRDNLTTNRAYQKEAERLLLWCVYERGLCLKELKTPDLEDYFSFLQRPPKRWLGSKRQLGEVRFSKNWRPLLGPLKKNSLLFAVRVINSLMNYLVDANYLPRNPIKLIKKYSRLAINHDEQKYQVWTKMLELDEWLAVQETLDNLPEATKREQQYKTRVQLVFALLYLLGLRVHELAESTWASFRQLNGNWWFFVEGKGGKLGHVPANNQLLSIIKIYRLSQGLLPLPQVNEQQPIFISQKTKQALGTRQLFREVKEIGKLAGKKFKDNIVKQQKLERLSPHWLRHLSASHQDLAGISGTIIQSNHRHNSFATTQIYLHAPDELRYREMQKIYMKISPKLYQEQTTPDTTKIQITLTPSSLSDLASFKRLINAIENNLLSEYNYERDQPLDYIINHYETIKQFKQSFNLIYHIDGLSTEDASYLKKAISREAEIRLFGFDVVV